jgi:50S ribosomal subunit-associated GTPase HflX
MNLPYSSRTLLSSGKALEVAALCEETDADLVVFVTSLTDRQQNVLTGIFDRPATSLTEIIDVG